MRRLVVVLLALTLAPAAAQAKPHNGVQPDPSFGDGHGYATLQISGQDTIAYAATAVSGATVVAGQATPSSGNGAGQVLVAKYDHSGKLDPGFGTAGVYRSSFPDADGPFIANGIAEDSHGRLVVAGGYGGGSVLVLRLTATGHVDSSFGTGGRTVVDTGGVAQSVAIEKDGGILVGSSNANENGRPMVVVRLTHNGAVDPSFGTNGKTEILFWDPNRAAPRPASPPWPRDRTGPSSALATSTTSAATGTAVPGCSRSPPPASSTPATARAGASRSRSPTRTAPSRSGSRAGWRSTPTAARRSPATARPLPGTPSWRRA